MPFTQREIYEAFEITCRFHGVDPKEWGVRPPLLGNDIAKNSGSDVIIRTIKALLTRSRRLHLTR